MMIRRSIVVINKNCLSFLPQNEWREIKIKIKEETTVKWENWQKNIDFNYISVPSFHFNHKSLQPDLTHFFILHCHRSVSESRVLFGVLMKLFNRPGHQAANKTKWNKIKTTNSKKQESLRSHRLRSFVFSFVSKMNWISFFICIFLTFSQVRGTYSPSQENRLGMEC